MLASAQLTITFLFSAAPGHEMVSPMYKVGCPTSVNQVRKILAGMPTDKPGVDSSSFRCPPQVT